MKRPVQFQKGFTLVELLVVITLIGILAGIMLSVINWSKHLGESRNTKRRFEVHTLSTAIFQYIVDNDRLPAGITNNETLICGHAASDCTGFVDLSVLTANSKYLITIPQDPSENTANSSGYSVFTSASGRVTVNAPLAENGHVIAETR